jgi:hypothetical protein
MLAVNLAAGVVIHSYYIWSYESPNVTFSIAQAGLLFPEFTSQSVGILDPLYLYAFFIPLNFAYLLAWAGFGVLASSFVALASYLFSLGFYFTAIYISQDMQLRRSIRKYVMQESTKLLDSIGTAQMEQ